MNTYEIRPRKDRRGFNLTGPLIPFGLWYGRAEQAESYARWLSTQSASSGELVIYDASGSEVSREPLAVYSGPRV